MPLQDKTKPNKVLAPIVANTTEKITWRCRFLSDFLSNKSTTNRRGGVWALALTCTTSRCSCRSTHCCVWASDQTALESLTETLQCLHAVPHVHTPCLRKTKQICFYQNCATDFDNFWQKMANDPNICEVHSFSTSPNLRHQLTVLNANVPNCYIMPNVVICNKLLSVISAQ